VSAKAGDGKATDPEAANQPDALARAFDDWVAAQHAAIETMREADVPRTPTDEAEGYRWVTRLASLAQDWFVEKADPLHPVLFVAQHESRKLLVDNPDVRYLFSVLDDGHAYRLTGTRGEAAYIGLTFGTPIGKGAVGGRTGTLTQVHLDQFELGPNGEVDLVISPTPPEPRPTNWVELVAGTGQLAVRETFFDRRIERPAELRLDILDDVPPPILRPDDLVPRLEFASLFIQFVAATAVQMWRDTDRNINTFGGQSGAAHVAEQEDEVRSHSDADMTYHGGRWVLGEDEALLVTVEPPAWDFLYWGLTITNPWMESYDYRYTTTALNNRRAVRSEDGRWRLAIAPTDPGVTNWIDTGGRREGYMLVRWVLAGQDPPHPGAELIPIDRVRDLVP
jgi:hypothetical protein